MERMEEEVLQQGANIERATSIMTEVVPQELASTMEPLEKISNTLISKGGPH